MLKLIHSLETCKGRELVLIKTQMSDAMIGFHLACIDFVLVQDKFLEFRYHDLWQLGDLVLGRCFGKRDSDERLFRQKIFLSMRFFCIRLHNPTLQPSSRVFSALFLGGLILNSD